MLQAASPRFQQLGMVNGERAAKYMVQAQVSRALGRWTSLSLGVLEQQRRPDILRQDSLRFRAANSSLGVRLWRGTYLSFMVSYSPDLLQKMTGALTLVVPLAPRRTLVSSTDVEGGQLASSLDLTQSLPLGNGYGYRARINTSGPQHALGEFTLQNNFGRYTVESEQTRYGTNLRIQETGSLVWMRKYVVPSRWLDSSFALVEVPHNRGVRVFARNQLSATTSRRGLALIPDLVPYDRNTLYIDDSGVPLTMDLDFSEKTVVPMPRTGVLVRFKANEVKGALFVLVTSAGQPVPVGAEVRVGDDPQPYSVALRGEVFVPSLAFPVRLRVTWGTSACEVAVSVPSSAGPLPRIGPLLCNEVKP